MVVAILVINVPMSWHKAHLSTQVVWIGWQFDFELFVVRLEPAKLLRLLALLREVRGKQSCTSTVLEKVTGKLLWLSSLFRTFRPSLAPLYADQHAPVPAMSAVSPEIWVQLRSSLSAELLVTKPLPLAALPMGTKLLRVGHTPVRRLADVPSAVSSRRIWIQTSNPSRPERSLSDVSRSFLHMWHDTLQLRGRHVHRFSGSAPGMRGLC